MIDRELVEGLDNEMRDAVISALSLIKESGIIQAQLGRELTRLGQGAPDESDEKLADRIRAYRQRRSLLLALAELGELGKEN